VELPRGKKEGEAFAAGDVLLEIETDKATIDVEAQDDGVLGKILVPDGTKNVKIGKVIALLAEEGDDISNLQPPQEEQSSQQKHEPSEPTSSPPAPAPAPPKSSPKPSASPSEPILHSGPIFPSVYRLLAEHSIHDASKITGTGIRGMITKGDILAFLGQASGPLGTFKQSPTPIEAALKDLQKKDTAPKAVPLDGAAIRRLIVSTMLQNSVKARAATRAPIAPDFDSIIADYLPPSTVSPSTNQVTPIPPSVKTSSSFLDGLL